MSVVKLVKGGILSMVIYFINKCLLLDDGGMQHYVKAEIY
jgi:hypothetical protein